MIHALNIVADYVAGGALLLIVLVVASRAALQLKKRLLGPNHGRGVIVPLRGSQGDYGASGMAKTVAKRTQQQPSASSAYCERIEGKHPLLDGCNSEVSNG